MNIHYLDHPRFTEPEDDTADLTGVAVEFDITDAPVMIGTHVITRVSGRAHVSCDRNGHIEIDDLKILSEAGVLVPVSEERGTGSPTLEGHIARALAAEVDKVAIEKLREAM